MRNKRIVSYTLFMLLVSGALFFSVYKLTCSLTCYVNVIARLKTNRVIVIDPGHGDFDPGAVSNGVDEKELNLNISLVLRDIFEANGYTVMMTRTNDTTLANIGPTNDASAKSNDTHNRVSFVDALDDSVMISIHQNAFNDHKQNGTQVFYGTINPESKKLAQAIQETVSAKLQTENSRETKKGTSNIFILVHTKAPIVLVECGFMTNETELEKLKDKEYQRSIAYSIFLGYTEYEKIKE